MACVMQIWSPPELEGWFVRAFDFEARGGRGWGEFTRDPAKAKRFNSHQEAFLFYLTQSETTPRRPDGQPNRPLTALSVEFMRL